MVLKFNFCKATTMTHYLHIMFLYSVTYSKLNVLISCRYREKERGSQYVCLCVCLCVCMCVCL